MSKVSDIKKLRSRLEDLAQGAGGNVNCRGDHEDDGGLYHSMGPDLWLRWVMSIRQTFQASSGSSPEPGKAPPDWFELHNLENFAESFQEAAEFLYEAGCRP